MPAAGAKLARRAVAAAIAPRMTVLAIAEIAGVGVLPYELDEGRAAERFGERPGGGLVEVHQGCFDRDFPIETERDGLFLSAHGCGAAVGIAGIVGLAHACDEHREPATIGKGSGV